MAALAQRVAVVTGGAGALGGAVTARLLAAEAPVDVPLETSGDGDSLRARLPWGTGERVLTQVADATSLDAMTRFVGAVMERHGRVDILVTLVGGFAGGALVETDRATWDRMLTM